MAIRLSSARHFQITKWLTRLALVLAILCTASRSGMAAGPPDFTIHTHTNEVQLSFSAFDQKQRSVPDLRPNDFVVVDKDLIVRNFQSFTSVQSTPIDLALLIDNSESMNSHFQHEISAVLELLDSSTQLSEAHLSVFAFHNLEPVTICAGNCRSSNVAQKVAQLSASGSTPLYDSISFAADFLAAHSDPQSQRVLILLSDGQDTVSRKCLQDTAFDLLRDGVQAHAIDLNAAPSHGTAVLRWLANASGGRVLRSDQGVSNALHALLDSLHTSYTVTYLLPSQARGFHSIRILPTHNLNLQFHSRSGYYYPDSTSEEQ